MCGYNKCKRYGLEVRDESGMEFAGDNRILQRAEYTPKSAGTCRTAAGGTGAFRRYNSCGCFRRNCRQIKVKGILFVSHYQTLPQPADRGSTPPVEDLRRRALPEAELPCSAPLCGGNLRCAKRRCQQERRLCVSDNWLYEKLPERPELEMGREAVLGCR